MRKIFNAFEAIEVFSCLIIAVMTGFGFFWLYIITDFPVYFSIIMGMLGAVATVVYLIGTNGSK